MSQAPMSGDAEPEPVECPDRTCEYGSDDHCATVGGCLVRRVGPARSSHPGPPPGLLDDLEGE
jgi:hypothetical protein